jgi:hypothetical protein
VDLFRVFRRRSKKFSELEIPSLPAGADGLRLMMAESQGQSYKYFSTLSQAIANKAIVILQGDYAGQIYLTCPAEKVKCSEVDLKLLLEYLDAKAWKDLSSAGIFYELCPDDGTVSGGMGGGLVINGVWLHSRFVDIGIKDNVENFILGKSTKLEKL